MENTSNGTLRFGVFEADVEARELRKHGRRVKLQDQPFQVLALLLKRQGEIVTREELQAAIWPDGTFIEFDHGINVAVQKIRAALGDNASSPRFIETVPKRGYRFLAEAKDSAPSLPLSDRIAKVIKPKVLAGLGAAAATLVIVLILTTSPGAAPRIAESPRHFVISTEDDVSVLSNRAFISPDGRWIAYESGGGGGASATTLWLQDLQLDKPRQITGSGRLSLIGWSPDSRQLSFMQGPDLFRLPVETLQPFRIASLDFGAPAPAGCWSPDGQAIILAHPVGARLLEVEVRGGRHRVALSLDAAPGLFNSVVCLPGSDETRTVLYGETRGTKERIVVADLTTGEQSDVVSAGHRPFYSPTRHIIYQASKNRIMVLPFSTATLAATGPAIEYRRGGRNPTVSENGTLVYLTRGGGSMQIVWRDRRGVEIGTVGQPQELVAFPALSPDGTWVAVRGEDDGVAAIWLHEVARPAKKRITYGPWAFRPTWRPDGGLIAYTAPGKVYGDIFARAPDGLGEPITVLSESYGNYPYSWSSDGRSLLFEAFRKPGQRSDIFRIEVSADGARHNETEILATEFGEHSAVLSPDERFLAYVSDKSGRHEVYVRSYPDGGREWLVSTDGGEQPRWRGDGRELYYVQRDDATLFTVPVSLSPEFAPGHPERLFQDDNLAFSGPQYDVTPDGERFVVPKVLEGSKSVIRVVDNWFAELEALEGRAQ